MPIGTEINKMAIDAQLSGALEALREQKIAVLGLKFNNTEISPGDFVKKGGMSAHFILCPP